MEKRADTREKLQADQDLDPFLGERPFMLRREIGSGYVYTGCQQNPRGSTRRLDASPGAMLL